MADWLLVLAPLLLLPIVALLGFVGCGELHPVPDDDEFPLPPRASTPYRDYLLNVFGADDSIQKNKGVIPDPTKMLGYWRLIDPDVAPLAHDEKGFQDGRYHLVAAGLPDHPPSAGRDDGSAAANGTFLSGQDDLVGVDSSAKCRIFNGGDAAGAVADRLGVGTWPTTVTVDEAATVSDIQVGLRASRDGRVQGS